jgi:hypothetical protein
VDAFRVARAEGAAAFVAGFSAFGAGVSVEACVAGFRLTGRALGPVLELSVFRVVFAMSSVVPFLKRAAAPHPRAVSCSGELLSKLPVYHAPVFGTFGEPSPYRIVGTAARWG